MDASAALRSVRVFTPERCAPVSYSCSTVHDVQFHEARFTAFLPRIWNKMTTAAASLDAALSRDAFQTACVMIFDELCAGRGISVPNLGTFTIDVRERFRGAHAGMVVSSRRPVLLLSATFEKLGVKLPASKPFHPPPAHMLQWQTLAKRCGTDRDLVHRAVATALSSFMTQVAGMATSPARSCATLDLGPCGKLRIIRVGGMHNMLEPRPMFSEDLIATISSGPWPKGGADADEWVLVDALEGEPIEPSADLLPAPAVIESNFLTLAGLGRIVPAAVPVRPACVAAVAPGAAHSRASNREAEKKITDISLSRAPLDALPVAQPDVDEWAVRKLQNSRQLNGAARRVLSSEERRRRMDQDLANRTTVSQRAVVKKEPSSPAKGVDKLLQRLAARPDEEALRVSTVAPDAGEAGEGPGEATEAVLLLRRKAELQEKLHALEKQLDEVSVLSARSNPRMASWGLKQRAYSVR